MYRRVLLKISGEQLLGKFDSGFDTERAAWIADELKKVEQGVQIVIMVGGGNIARGAQLSNGGIKRVTADNMGMLATMINGLALSDVLNENGVDARVLTNVEANQMLDLFTHRRAMSHLKKSRVVIVAGGVGRPYFTTDTAAVNLALELGCDAILKATKVDGVYDKDPVKFSDAVKYDTLSLQEAIEQPEIRVMDKAALALAADNGQRIVVFELLHSGNIAAAISGQTIGTVVA